MRTETHRRVDGLPALEVGVLAQPVVGAPKHHARAAPRHQAHVDGREAPKEAVVPRLRARRRLGVDVLAGAREHVVEPPGPVGHIVVVDGLRLLLRGRHFVRRLKKRKLERPGIKSRSKTERRAENE